MVKFSITTEVTEDRRVVIDLPPATPLGAAELVVTVRPQNGEEQKRPRTSLADWAEENAEDWGGRLRSDDVEGFTGRRF